MVYYSDLHSITNLEGSIGTSIKYTSFHVSPDFFIDVSTLAIYPNET